MESNNISINEKLAENQKSIKDTYDNANEEYKRKKEEEKSAK